MQNGYVLYCMYTSDRRRMSHLQFLQMAGEALVNFQDQWPSMSEPIPRALDLPLEERADAHRLPSPLRRQLATPPVPPMSSSDEEAADDPGMPPPPPPPPRGPAAAPADDPAAAPVDAPVDAPAAIPSRRVVDPVGRLQPGNHTLEAFEGGRQRRCRVCHMNERR